jgi:broad specificity phosphatase PhoE
MIQLLAIRHAATDWNEAGRIQGRADRPLSESGRSWAGNAVLPDGWADASCLSSPLVRAVETARLMGLQPRPEPLLVEMDWGAWEGRRLADLRAELGVAMAENEARGLDFRPPGGESPRDVQERLRRFLAGLSTPTVAVTHRGVLRALYAMATDWTMRDRPLEKLLPGCAHLFAVAGDGSIAVEKLNLQLEPRR